MSKTIGYIIECESGGGMGWLKNNGHTKKEQPFALFFNYVTVFPNRKTAERAIKETIRYDADFESRIGKLKIRRAVGDVCE